MILKCENCKIENIRHKYQDREYGQFIRVQNKTSKVKDASRNYYRCTVCGQIN